MKTNRAMLLGMIAITQQELKSCRPKSDRHKQLEFRLRDLMTQRLVEEIREDRKLAS